MIFKVWKVLFVKHIRPRLHHTCIMLIRYEVVTVNESVHYAAPGSIVLQLEPKWCGLADTVQT